MNKTEILVTGRNQRVEEIVADLIRNNDEWVATKAATNEEAIEKFHRCNFDVVVLTDDNGEGDRKLRKIFTIQNPDIIVQ